MIYGLLCAYLIVGALFALAGLLHAWLKPDKQNEGFGLLEVTVGFFFWPVVIWIIYDMVRKGELTSSKED